MSTETKRFRGLNLCGDCLEVMKSIPDKTVDMILTDLPYGTTDCKWDSIIPFEPMWREYERIAKPNAAIVLFSAQPFTTQLISSNIKHFRYCWYWLKPYATGFTFAKYQPMRRVEDICVFYKKQPKYNPIGLKRLDNPVRHSKRETPDSVYKSRTLTKEHEQLYTGYPRNVLEYGSDVYGSRARLHPTQKPVKLCEYLIRTYTGAGDIVLDSCAGSGTTAEACIRTGRYYIAIEQDEKYYSRAAERLNCAENEAEASLRRMRESIDKIEQYLKGWGEYGNQ